MNEKTHKPLFLLSLSLQRFCVRPFSISNFIAPSKTRHNTFSIGNRRQNFFEHCPQFILIVMVSVSAHLFLFYRPIEGSKVVATTTTATSTFLWVQPGKFSLIHVHTIWWIVGGIKFLSFSFFTCSRSFETLPLHFPQRFLFFIFIFFARTFQLHC